MLTTSVHFGKILLNLELAKVQTGQIFDRFFGRDELMSVSRTNFDYIFIDLFSVRVPFLKAFI